MKIWSTILMGTILWTVPALAQDIAPSTGQTAGGGADSNMQILLQKIKADKKLVVAANMDLSDAEGKKFWPLYDAYQKELEQINQRLGRAIKTYADAFNAGQGSVSGETAKKLLDDALSIEESEVKLKRAYANKIGKVLSSTKTARYIQIENKIRAMIKAELAQEIPLVY